MKRRSFVKKSMVGSGILCVSPFLSSAFFTSKNELPNVLLIGDSISIGYTPFVQDLLKNKAHVFRPMLENGKAENCSGTTNGVENIERWLGTTKWDVIHFNFGLHDLKHVNPETGAASTNSKDPVQASPGKYKKNLQEIVKKLKQSGAKLIFATTTPYPDKTNGPLREPGMPKKYNNVAIKIMNRNGISINDLYAFVVPRMNEIQLPNNVHFSKEGYYELAKKVSDRISEIL